MRQLAQSLGSGKIEVRHVPEPLFGEREALVQVRASPTAVEPNPYYGPSGLYDDMNPAQLLALFPWGSLEVLRMQLGLTGN